MFSIDGLVSGFDTTSLINQILNIERRPISIIQRQVEQATNKRAAYLDLSARLLALQVSTNRLSSPDFFSAVSAQSSNSDLLTVSAGAGTPPGSYSFRVAQMARASQFTSTGFASGSSLVGAGTLSFEQGGFVDGSTDLERLNGGLGVSRGTIRITDAAGATALVDLSAAIDVDDVIRAIEDAGVQVSARISDSGRGIALEDTSGGGGLLTVEDVEGRTTALDLGILGTASGAILTGGDVLVLDPATNLDALRDGLGIRRAPGDDLQITRRDGTVQTLDLEGVTTVQGLIEAFSALDPALVLSVGASGGSLVLTDGGPGAGPLTIEDLGTSRAATDLGLAGSATSGSIVGGTVLAGLNDRLLSNLNGGAGVTAGSIEITDRAGVTTTVDLSGAQTLQEVIRAIEASGAAVAAGINRQGNGLSLIDTSGGSGALQVSEVGGGDTASGLGLLGSVTGPELEGGDLDPRYVDENTRLQSLNGGAGVAAGRIRLIDSNGISFTVDLGQEETIADVIRDIEGAASSAGSDITIGVNATGNGLILQSASGSQPLRIEEVDGGTTARDLGILGTGAPAAPGTIDGSFERTLTIEATDTLEDVREKIDGLGMGLTASILNDGSAGSPFRLSVVGRGSGQASRLQIGATGSTALNFQRTSEAQDGILFYGEDGPGSSAIMIRSSSNTYTDLIQGMTVTARGLSAGPVTVDVARNHESVVDQMDELVGAMNGVLEQIDALTSFDVESETAGLLLGDSTVRSVERQLLRALTRPLGVEGSSYAVASELGIRLKSGKITFDRTAFEAALTSDPESVERFFGAARALTADTVLSEFRNGLGVRTAAGENDIRIDLRDGTQIEVDLDGAETVQQVLDAINAAGGGSVTAELGTDGHQLVLRDLTSGSEVFRVSSIHSSGTANDLGIATTADIEGGGVLTGAAIDLTNDPGIASRLTDVIEAITDASDGVLQRRSNGLDELIESLNDRIEKIEERLLGREEILRRQFANLEQIMAQSQSTMDRLNASLLGLG